MKKSHSRSARAPGVKAEGSRSELRNEQGACEHGDIFHEQNHLYLRHHGILYRPELVHHEGNWNQEEHNEPSSKLCAVAQQNMSRPFPLR